MAGTAEELISKVQDLVPDVDSEISNPSNSALDVLIIGSPQQNLFGVLNEILGDMEPLDSPMMSGFRGTIVFGESTTVLQTDSEIPVASDLDKLCETLKKYNKNSVQHRFMITRNHPLLSGCNLHVLASDVDYEDVNWNTELSSADYIFFTMSSTSLLSMSERKILRNWLLPYAKDATSVILTNDNLIVGSDREDIQETLNGTLHDSVPVFRMPTRDSAALIGHIEKLKSNCDMLHNIRAARMKRLVLTTAKKAIELQIEVCSKNDDDIQNTIQTIRNSGEELPKRAKAAIRQARMQHLEPMRLYMTRAIMDFQNDLDAHLRQEILESESTDELTDVLVSYIADAWKRESDYLLEQIQLRALEMQKDLQLYIEKDFRNHIECAVGATDAEYVYAITDLYFHPESLSFEESGGAFQYQSPQDTRKMQFYGTIAAGVALILFSHPIIGAAVATLGSKKIKKQSETAYENQNKQALISACEEANHEYNKDMLSWLTSVMDSIEKSITSSVDDCYQKMSDAVVKALSDRMEDKSEYVQRLKELRALKDEIDSFLQS